MTKFCGNCGNEVDEKAYICPKCGVLVNNETKTNAYNKVDDKGGIGWSFLGFFFPIVGLILYLVWKDNKPKSAKYAGKGALISVIIGVSIYILVMIFLGVLFTWMISGL